MVTPNLAMWLLAIALILHVIEEGWLPEYQRVQPDWRSVVFNRALILDNGLIFIFAILMGVVGWRWPIISGLLPAITLTHPIIDHAGLSYQARSLRPGSWTGLLLLLPLSIWVYAIAYTHGLFKIYEFLVSALIGIMISIGLLWSVVQETKRAHSFDE